jgi:hypothetical protein
MAGKYTTIDDKRDFHDAEYDEPLTPSNTFSGWTHGCDCCAHEQDIGEWEIDAHIRELREELRRAEEIRDIILELESDD